MMEIHTKKSGTLARIAITGKFVIEEVSKFEDSYQTILSSGVKTIGIDFSSVEYLDSSAIGALVKFMNLSKNTGAEVLLYNMNSSIHHIFKLAFLDRFFSITDSENLAKTFPDMNW